MVTSIRRPISPRPNLAQVEGRQDIIAADGWSGNAPKQQHDARAKKGKMGA